MMGLAKSFSAASFSALSARPTSSPSSSMSNTLPWRTLATPAMPSALSAPSIAFPCGSSTPDFKVTVTRARNVISVRQSPSMRRKRSGAAGPPGQHSCAAASTRATLARMERKRNPGEAILVELLARLDVPQPAGVWRDLVGHDDAHHLVFPQPAAFHLEIDEPDADPEEEAGQEIVDPDGERHDVVDLLGRRPAERGDVLLRYHRIAERVVLVVEFDDGARQLRPLLDAEPLRQRAGGDVAHDDFERN